MATSTGTSGTFVTIRQEGKYIIIDLPEEGDVYEMRGTVSNYAIMGDSLMQRSFVQRLTGVKNSQWDVYLQKQHERIEKERQRQLRIQQGETARVSYDYKVMQMDQKWNELETTKRQNPDLDTTYDEKMMLQSSQYLRYNPLHCSYTDRSIAIPLRTTFKPGDVSPAVAKARHVMQLRDVDRQVEQIREKQQTLHAEQTALSLMKSVQFDTDGGGGGDDDEPDDCAVSVKSSAGGVVFKTCRKDEEDIGPRPTRSQSMRQETTTKNDSEFQDQTEPGLDRQWYACHNHDPDREETLSVRSDGDIAKFKVMMRSYDGLDRPECTSQLSKMIITPQPSRLNNWTESRSSIDDLDLGTQRKRSVAIDSNSHRSGHLTLPQISKQSSVTRSLTNFPKSQGSSINRATSPELDTRGADAIAKLRELGVIPPPKKSSTSRRLTIASQSLGTFGTRSKPSVRRAKSMTSQPHTHGMIDHKALQRERTEIDSKVHKYCRESDLRKRKEQEEATKSLSRVFSLRSDSWTDNWDESSKHSVDLTRDKTEAEDVAEEGRGNLPAEKSKLEDNSSASLPTASANISKLLVGDSAPTSQPTANGTTTLEMKIYTQTKGKLYDQHLYSSGVKRAKGQRSGGSGQGKAKKVGVPSRAANRSDRHSATFKLQRALAEMTKSRTTQQLLAMEKMKEKLGLKSFDSKPEAGNDLQTVANDLLNGSKQNDSVGDVESNYENTKQLKGKVNLATTSGDLDKNIVSS